MVLTVTDRNGEVLGQFRMPDSTIFSIDVAVAKARNTAYYADPNLLQPADQLPGIPAGTAFSNRTFRYLAEPRFPEGIEGATPGPFSILNDGGVENVDDEFVRDGRSWWHGGQRAALDERLLVPETDEIRMRWTIKRARE